MDFFGTVAMADRLFLVRHADPGSQYAGRYVGSSDIPLGERGRRQSKALACWLGLRPAGRCFSSPLLRTRQTAEAIAGELALSVEIDPDLREIDFGDWEGHTFEQIVASDPQSVDRWASGDPEFTFPKGEKVQDFLDRVHRVARKMAAEPTDAILAVTHGGTIRATICHLLGLPARGYVLFNVKPASLTTIELHSGRGVLAGLTDPSDLEGV